MKQTDIMKAYKLLESLADNQALNKMDQWNLYKLRLILRPHFDFQVEQENIIQQKYIELADELGNLSGEPAKQYMEEINAVGNLDVEMDEFEKPQIRMVDGITFKIIEPLEEFVEFLPPEE